MNSGSKGDIGRRDFLKVSFVAATGLAVGFNLSPDAGTADAAEVLRLTADRTLEPNAWIRIHPDNSVTVMVNHSEMGQGITTGRV